MTVSLAYNLFISLFKVKNAFAITAEEMLANQYLKKELVKFLLIFDVCFKTNLLMTEVELAADLQGRQVRDYLLEGMTDDEILAF